MLVIELALREGVLLTVVLLTLRVGVALALRLIVAVPALRVTAGVVVTLALRVVLAVLAARVVAPALRVVVVVALADDAVRAAAVC